MILFSMLRGKIGYSLAASAFQLLSTIVAVRLAGPAIFADVTVDIFKLAVLAIFLELVPTPYATVRWQRDPEFAPHMATVAGIGSLFCLAGWLAMAGTGLFNALSWWMAPYAMYLGVQRYLDMMLQAENRINEYYQLLGAAGVLRFGITTGGMLLIDGHDVDILWAALSLSLLLSTAFWLLRRPSTMTSFLRRGHWTSVKTVFAGRRAYYAYYTNTALKRLRDSFLPVAASFVVGDKVELARYLLAMRAVEFVLGQLRVVEALLANLENRAASLHNRTSQLLVLAIIAQTACFVASAGLTVQTGLTTSVLLVSAVASLFSYPYVFELGYRSDAYAEDAPLRVTISLAAFTMTLMTGLLIVSRIGLEIASALVAIPVLAQTVASLTYLFSRRVIVGRQLKT